MTGALDVHAAAAAADIIIRDRLPATHVAARATNTSVSILVLSLLQAVAAQKSQCIQTSNSKGQLVQTLSQPEARCMDAIHRTPTTSAKGTSAGCAGCFVAHLLLTIAPPLYGLQQTASPTLPLEPVQRAIY